MELEQQNKMYYKEILGLRKHLEELKNKVHELNNQNEYLREKLRRKEQTVTNQGKRITELKNKLR